MLRRNASPAPVSDELAGQYSCIPLSNNAIKVRLQTFMSLRGQPSALEDFKPPELTSLARLQGKVYEAEEVDSNHILRRRIGCQTGHSGSGRPRGRRQCPRPVAATCNLWQGLGAIKLG